MTLQSKAYPGSEDVLLPGGDVLRAPCRIQFADCVAELLYYHQAKPVWRWSHESGEWELTACVYVNGRRSVCDQLGSGAVH